MGLEHLVADINSVYIPRSFHVIERKFVANGW